MEIMGIVNITPDSFSDGGIAFRPEDAFSRIETLIKAGADWIDIGASSSRPGSTFCSADEEIERLGPVIESYFSNFQTPLSVDTVYARVAEYVLSKGATLINDISGLKFDPEMKAVISRFNAGVVIMHMKGIPGTMQQSPQYDDVVGEVVSFFQDQVKLAQSVGISKIWIDPGIGFGKTLAHNVTLLQEIRQIVDLGVPVVLGTSRKSFIDALSPSRVDQRLGGTIASCLWGWTQGVQMVRVHDVAAVKQALIVGEALWK